MANGNHSSFDGPALSRSPPVSAVALSKVYVTRFILIPSLSGFCIAIASEKCYG